MHFLSGWAEADVLFCMILCKIWVGLAENTYVPQKNEISQNSCAMSCAISSRTDDMISKSIIEWCR